MQLQESRRKSSNYSDDSKKESGSAKSDRIEMKPFDLRPEKKPKPQQLKLSELLVNNLDFLKHDDLPPPLDVIKVKDTKNHDCLYYGLNMYFKKPH